jgi:hypothetical protein
MRARWLVGTETSSDACKASKLTGAKVAAAKAQAAKAKSRAHADVLKGFEAVLGKPSWGMADSEIVAWDYAAGSTCESATVFSYSGQARVIWATPCR